MEQKAKRDILYIAKVIVFIISAFLSGIFYFDLIYSPTVNFLFKVFFISVAVLSFSSSTVVKIKERKGEKINVNFDINSFCNTFFALNIISVLLVLGQVVVSIYYIIEFFG